MIPVTTFAGKKVALGVLAVAAMVGSGVVGAVVATSMERFPSPW